MILCIEALFFSIIELIQYAFLQISIKFQTCFSIIKCRRIQISRQQLIPSLSWPDNISANRALFMYIFSSNLSSTVQKPSGHRHVQQSPNQHKAALCRKSGDLHTLLIFMKLYQFPSIVIETDSNDDGGDDNDNGRGQFCIMLRWPRREEPLWDRVHRWHGWAVAVATSHLDGSAAL